MSTVNAKNFLFVNCADDDDVFLLSGSVVRCNSSHIFHGDWEANDHRPNGEGKQGRKNTLSICFLRYLRLGCAFFFNVFLHIRQSPKAFLESYEDMLLYTQREETWPVTKMELEGRGVCVFVHFLYHVYFSNVPVCSACIKQNVLFVSWCLQVVCMNFFDIVLDFILMDAFEDLESPPSSVVAVLRNRWLSDSFKETVTETNT